MTREQIEELFNQTMTTDEIDPFLLSVLGELFYGVSLNLFKRGLHEPLNRIKDETFVRLATLAAMAILARFRAMGLRDECE